MKVKLLGFEVDWHYAMGRGIIKTLSDVNEVREAFIANGHTLYVGG